MKFADKERLFWTEVFNLRESAMPLILPRALLIGLFALLVTAIDRNSQLSDLSFEITPFELAGGALSLLLVLRTNAGYERWWEGRRLWGDIVNRCRNLAIAALSLGPDDPAWRDRVVRLTVAFAHASRRSLRGDRTPTELIDLLGADEASEIVAAEHMPTAVARQIGETLRAGRDRLGLDGFAVLAIEPHRAALIDDIGGCERILKSPLPLAYRIEIRRFLILFLGSLPFALVERVEWLTPAVTILVALPLLAIDKIGTELQYPFSTNSLNHLPLDGICGTIEQNLLALLEPSPASAIERSGTTS
jgi:putative membrane protein